MDELSLFDFLPEEEAERFKAKKSDDWKWSFSDYPKQTNGIKVFSCFACGGGRQWDISSQAVRFLGAAR